MQGIEEMSEGAAIHATAPRALKGTSAIGSHQDVNLHSPTTSLHHTFFGPSGT